MRRGGSEYRAVRRYRGKERGQLGGMGEEGMIKARDEKRR